MDDCCDLRTGSILATGLLWVLPGIAALLVPRDAMGYAVVRTGMIILIPAAVIFPGSLFSGTAGPKRD